MDLDPKDAMLGYKFEADPKKSIIQLPSDNLTTFNMMIEKTKSRITRARTRAVVLEIHDLVRFIRFVRTNCLPINLQAAKKSLATPRKHVTEAVAPSLTVKQTRELKLLKEKLQCAKGHRPWCWVATDGTHRVITIPQVSLWVQMIVRNFLFDYNDTMTNLLFRQTGPLRLRNPLQFKCLITSRNEFQRRNQFLFRRYTFIFRQALELAHHPPDRPGVCQR